MNVIEIAGILSFASVVISGLVVKVKIQPSKYASKPPAELTALRVMAKRLRFYSALLALLLPTIFSFLPLLIPQSLMEHSIELPVVEASTFGQLQLAASVLLIGVFVSSFWAAHRTISVIDGIG